MSDRQSIVDAEAAKNEIEMLEKKDNNNEADARLATAGDDNAKILVGQELDYSPDEERHAVRRLDMFLIPIMALGSGFQLVDKSALGAAATLTLKKDLHLVGTQYSWAVTIYYFGLLVATWPANLLMQRFHTGKVVGIAFLLWATTMLGMLGVNDFGGLVACRFLLGVFESAMAPAWTATTARFYTQKEQPLRFALWTISNTLLPIPFTLIYYAFGTLENSAMKPWRYIFLLLGLVTIVHGVIILIFFPDTPSTAWWLSERQRSIIVQRVAKSQTGLKNKSFNSSQMWEAITDPKAWLIVLMLTCQQTGVSLYTNFAGQIIKGFGFSELKSLLLQVPAWFSATVAVIGVGMLASLTKFWSGRKTWMLSVVASLVIASAAVLIAKPPGEGGKGLLVTMIVLLNTNGCGYGMILSFAGQNFAGATKKQTVVTMLFIFYCVSNICLPQAFLAREAPHYKTGILTVLCCQCLLLLCYLTFYGLVRRENSRRDKTSDSQVSGRTHEELVVAGLEDQTDKQNKYFRYSA